jgi:Protein of unknown function (DUF1002).
MKKMKVLLLLAFMFSIFPTSLALADGDGDGDGDAIDEKDGPVIVVYGGNLTPAQKDETARLLKVDQEKDVKEIVVTGEDIQKYINGDPNSRMFSSAKIKRLDEGKGIQVNIVTPENITEVTEEMYANALITAGVKDALIEVASPVKVTGHSALTGIFKAYEAGGEELDTARLEVADEELDVATKLAEEAGLDPDQVSRLLSEIKKAIAENKPATKEDVEKIINDKLKDLGIHLTDEQKQWLIDLFDKIRKLDIDFGAWKNQLSSLSENLKKKLKEAGIDQGFLDRVWAAVKSFFQKIAEVIKGFFE